VKAVDTTNVLLVIRESYIKTV